MSEAEVLAKYKDVLTRGGTSLALVVGLLAKQVCPRCCLRFARIAPSNDIYALAAPSCGALRHHLAASPAASPPAQAEPCCSSCAGVLQLEHTFPHARGQDAQNRLLSTLDDTQPGTWRRLTSLGAGDIAGVVTAERHRASLVNIQIFESAFTALRSVALWRQLQRELPAETALGSPDFVNNCVGVKDVVRSVRAPAVAAELGCSLGEGEVSICVTYVHPAEAQSVEWLRPQGIKRKRGHSFAKGYAWAGSPAVLRAAVAANPDDVLRRSALDKPTEPCVLAAKAFRQPVYLGGRYLKLKRNVSQSPWLTPGENEGKASTSVEEQITAKVLPALQADSASFMSAGREDIDVRMLGSGRPFVLTVHNAREPHLPRAAVAEVQRAISEAGAVAVQNLQLVDKAVLAAVKDGESEKRKTYLAVCWASRALSPDDVALLDSTSELTIQQGTPVRVLHRRAPLIRERVIHNMKCTVVPDKPQWFRLELTAQAGTYIKEFCNGDFGRTVPDVGTLLGGCEVQLVQLDVLHVHLDVCSEPVPDN